MRPAERGRVGSYLIKTATWRATAQGKSVNIALSLALTGVISVTGLAQVNSQTPASDRREDSYPHIASIRVNRTVRGR